MHGPGPKAAHDADRRHHEAQPTEHPRSGLPPTSDKPIPARTTLPRNQLDAISTGSRTINRQGQTPVLSTTLTAAATSPIQRSTPGRPRHRPRGQGSLEQTPRQAGCRNRQPRAPSPQGMPTQPAARTPDSSADGNGSHRRPDRAASAWRQGRFLSAGVAADDKKRSGSHRRHRRSTPCPRRKPGSTSVVGHASIAADTQHTPDRAPSGYELGRSGPAVCRRPDRVRLVPLLPDPGSPLPEGCSVEGIGDLGIHQGLGASVEDDNHKAVDRGLLSSDGR